MSFIRRYSSFPTDATLGAIEGVVIIDLPPPGSIKGINTGVVAMVGEFADMANAVSVSSAGVVSASYRPVEIYSAQDMLDKVGGFDATLGQFGTADGNGYAALNGLSFSRLVCVPVNLCSSMGIRLWRELPVNEGTTVAEPITPVQPGVIEAGRDFRIAANRFHIGTRVVFTDDAPRSTGVAGVITNAGGAAATQVITRTDPGGSWLTEGAAEGDIVVVGAAVNGLPTANSAGGTYRIVSLIAATLTVQRLDGLTWDWTTTDPVSWRVYPSQVADTGGDHQLSEAAGYIIPCRPLDAVAAAATLMVPAVTPTAPTATSWDVLSGLGGRTDPVTGLLYDTNVQSVNAANHADIAALYDAALESLLAESDPSRDVNIVVCARHASEIATSLLSYVREASGRGLGRIACLSPIQGASTNTVTEVIAAAYPGVAANRDERLIYCWPGLQKTVTAAIGQSCLLADASASTDGTLDTTTDTWMASILSNLDPHRNPAQPAPPCTTILGAAIGFVSNAPVLGMNEYITLKARGICAPRDDRTVGFTFQSGVTTSLTSGQARISRRRMADFIQDSIAARLVQFSKLPLTQSLKDSITGEVDAFLAGLLSQNNPAAQTIDSYEVDDQSGNTPTRLAAGIYVVIARVRTMATADVIVLQSEVGENVVVSAS